MRYPSIACVAALALTAPAGAATIHVPGGQPTIQAGIAAAVPGDTVLVAPGNYTGSGNRNLDFGGKAVVLRSSGGAATTVIDCQSLGRGFNFHSGETPLSVLEGFTVRNGYAVLSFGGGMFMSGASPAVRDCVFQNNRANTGGALFVGQSSSSISGCTFSGSVGDNWGGAGYVENSSLSFSGCSFSGNTAGIGAGLYATSSSTIELLDCSFTANSPANLAGGVFCRDSQLTLSRSTFRENTGKRGAGMYCIGSSAVSLDSCTFSMNTAMFLGGGMYAEEVASLNLSGCTFTGNETTTGTLPVTGGGGIYADMVDFFSMAGCGFGGNGARGLNGQGGGLYLRMDAPPTIERCAFSGNRADAHGGGVLMQATDARVTDCVFNDNSAGGRGGGLYGARGWLTRCTFSGNHSGDVGGGIFMDAASLEVMDCAFADNSATNEAGGISLRAANGRLVIRSTVLARNAAPVGGGLFVRNSGPSTMTDCIFDRNSAVTGAAAHVTRAYGGSGPTTFSGCTFVSNSGSFGNGINLDVTVTVDHTIIASGTAGEAVRCTDPGVAVLSCTDIFGNEGGDWTGCIADQLGINGCFAADPLFCNRLGGDYTLAATSPCAPANSPGGCGLIGALPVGCANPIGVGEWWAPAPAAPILRVVPNPLASEGLVEWSGMDAARLWLYDAAGRVVASRVARGPGKMGWADLIGARPLPSGLYFLRLEGTGASARVVVMR